MKLYDYINEIKKHIGQFPLKGQPICFFYFESYNTNSVG